MSQPNYKPFKSLLQFNKMSAAEVESDKYHHFAREVPGEEKRWTTGVNLK